MYLVTWRRLDESEEGRKNTLTKSGGEYITGKVYSQELFHKRYYWGFTSRRTSLNSQAQKEKIRKHLRKKRLLSSGTTFWRLNQNDFEVRAEVTRSQCYSIATVSTDNALSLEFREISEADGATVCARSAQYWNTDGTWTGILFFQLDKQPELLQILS